LAAKAYKDTQFREHGTDLMYDKGRCRCQDCRAAHAKRKREYLGKEEIVMEHTEGAIEELERLRDRLNKEIDALGKVIEQKQGDVININSTIRTLERLQREEETGIVVAPPVEEEEPEPDEPEPEDSTDAAVSAAVDSVIKKLDDEKKVGDNVPEGHRRCKKCAGVYELNRKNFAPNKRSLDGFIFTCNKCNKRPGFFIGKERGEPPPALGSGRKLDGRFRCNKCRTNFMNQKALDDHNAEYHDNKVDENRCPVTACRKKFSTETELENHIIHKHPRWAKEYGYA